MCGINAARPQLFNKFLVFTSKLGVNIRSFRKKTTCYFQAANFATGNRRSYKKQRNYLLIGTYYKINCHCERSEAICQE